jgi:hypothetical protein
MPTDQNFSAPIVLAARFKFDSTACNSDRFNFVHLFGGLAATIDHHRNPRRIGEKAVFTGRRRSREYNTSQIFTEGKSND